MKFEKYLRVLSYVDMNKAERLKAIDFMKNNDKLEEEFIEDSINGKIYSKGEGMFFCFLEDQIIAKGFLVMECIRPLGCGYIHKLSVLNSYGEDCGKIEDKTLEEGILKIVDKAQALGKEKGAGDIRLGFSNSPCQLRLKSLFEDKSQELSYRSFVMELEESRKPLEEEVLALRPVIELSLEEYMEVYNNSFEGAPHRGFMEIEEAREAFISKDNIYHYIVWDKEVKVGFLDFYIDEENQVGKFDLGILSEFRGKGYGKKILETAISYLVERNLGVQLIVLEPNLLAHKMYLKRGFNNISVMGNWLVL